MDHRDPCRWRCTRVAIELSRSWTTGWQSPSLDRIDDPALDVTPQDVLVMRASGPIGGPGMPEWGFLPLPKKILASGVRDMVRLSDARMSGTAFGTVVVHVTPESAAGGPLAAVRNGDRISLDVPRRRVDLLVEQREIERRITESPPRRPTHTRGYASMYARHVLQADRGCDFDYLLAEGSIIQSGR